MSEQKYPYSVLYVEDEEEIRKNYLTFLKHYFFEVYEAADGEVAYKLYREKKPHIMIVDINIPKLNGIDLLKKIRKVDHTTKVIILTAHDNKELLLEAVDLKLTKYLVKPISRSALKEALNTTVEELAKFTVHANTLMNLKENFTWDATREKLEHNSIDVALTKQERKLFGYLIKNRTQVCKIEAIIFEIWSEYNEGNLSSLKTIIKNLRKKLPQESIKNIFGVGYQLDM